MQPDVVRGTVAFLRAQPGVTAITGNRVFAEELPESEHHLMPRAAIVVSSAGGGLLGNSNRFGDRRVDVICYGASPMKARQLHNEIRAALKGLVRQVVTDSASTKVLLHWARISADGRVGRDPNTDWPVCGSSWQILAADIPA